MRDPGPVVRGAERVWCPCPGGQGGAEHRAEKTTRAPHPQSTPSAEGAGGRRVSSSWPRAPDPRPPAAPLRPNSSSGCTRRRPPTSFRHLLAGRVFEDTFLGRVVSAGRPRPSALLCPLCSVLVTAPSPRPGGDTARCGCSASSSQGKPRVAVARRQALWAVPGRLVPLRPSRTAARPSPACPVPRASWSGQGLASRGASRDLGGENQGSAFPWPLPGRTGHVSGHVPPLRPQCRPGAPPPVAGAPTVSGCSLGGGSCRGWSPVCSCLSTASASRGSVSRLRAAPGSASRCCRDLGRPWPPRHPEAVPGPAPSAGPVGLLEVHSLRPPTPMESESVLSEDPATRRPVCGAQAVGEDGVRPRPPSTARSSDVRDTLLPLPPTGRGWGSSPVPGSGRRAPPWLPPLPPQAGQRWESCQPSPFLCLAG